MARDGVSIMVKNETRCLSVKKYISIHDNHQFFEFDK